MLLRELQETDRPPTVGEQTVLARWSGWGAVPAVFDDAVAEFAAEREKLRGRWTRGRGGRRRGPR